MIELEDPACKFRALLHQNLTRMRSFARALTGTQKRADLCVVQLMEDLLLAPQQFNFELDPRLALYSRLLQLLFLETQQPDPINVSRVTPRSRQAHLLVTIEEFTREQAAAVLNVGSDALNALLVTAQLEFKHQRGARILIIEDESFVALELEYLVGELGHKWLDTATTMSDAIEKANKLKPDLILSDVQLADGSSGIDAIEKIQKQGITPVIFITANPAVLLTGKRPEPPFLIEKPFNKHVVAAMINQALFLNAGSIKFHEITC